MDRMTRLAPLLTLFAASCAVGPKYSRPEVPMPPAHRFVEGEAQA